MFFDYKCTKNFQYHATCKIVLHKDKNTIGKYSFTLNFSGKIHLHLTIDDEKLCQPQRIFRKYASVLPKA